MEFPKLVRKKHLKIMLRYYMEYYLERVDRIGGSALERLAKVLTSQDQKAKKAVDYASVILLDEIFHLIRRVV